MGHYDAGARPRVWEMSSGSTRSSVSGPPPSSSIDSMRRAQAFDEAHELKPGEVGCTFMLGVTCRRQGELDAAVTYLAEAAVRDPDLTQALVELGIAYGALERHADAERVCREVLTKDPDNIEARLGLAVALFHQDENEAAVEQFREVLERDPDERPRSLRTRARAGLRRATGKAPSRRSSTSTHMRRNSAADLHELGLSGQN